MAEEQEDSQAEDESSSGGMIGKIIVWSLIFVLGAGTGAAVPLFLLPSRTSQANEDPNALPRMDIPEPDDEVAFVDFDEVVVNLNDPRYSRFMSCTFSLQVAASQQQAIQELVEKKKVVLINWLIAHMREKELEDVRGKLGHNALRREIFDKFNELLFTDGIERIQDVLFKDFKVQ